MKPSRFFVFIGVLLLASPALHAQDFLQKAKSYLETGECEKAQKAYDAYKVEVPEGDSDVAQLIAECKDRLQKKNNEIEEDAAYKNANSIAKCDVYLQRYPNGKYMQEVRQRKMEMEEKEAYEDCASVARCNTYLTNYPNGKHRKEVSQKKRELEELEEDKAYSDCKDFAKCNEYLRKYPDGRYYWKVLTMRSSFGSCGTVKDSDGDTYHTIKIGSQCWMAENLGVHRYPDRREIAQGSKYDKKTDSYNYKASFLKGYYYYPKGSPIYYHEYGLLYNWEAASYKSSATTSNPDRVQGVCPDGWHLPSWSEWEQMIEFVKNEPMYLYDNKPLVRKALASLYYWETSDSDELQVGNNSKYNNNTTGFEARPAGQYCERTFPEVFSRKEACFWSSTEDGEGRVLCLKITAYYASPLEPISADTTLKNCGLSVRCVRDPD